MSRGPGFAEALELMYGENTVRSIFQGKNYARSMQAHDLLATTLKELLVNALPPENTYAIEAMSNLYQNLVEENDTALDLDALCKTLQVTHLSQLIEDVQKTMIICGIDWLASEYLRMYDILMMNYHAERLGLWDDYVSSLQLMLPYMAGAGHRPYTKTLARWLDEIGKLDADTLEFFQRGFS